MDSENRVQVIQKRLDSLEGTIRVLREELHSKEENDLRDCLEKLEEVIRLLENKINTLSHTESKPTTKDIQSYMAGLSENPEWKQYIFESGVINNIIQLLEDSYHPFVDCIKEEFKKDAKIFIGTLGSAKWNSFMFNVIKTLLTPDDFDEDYDFFDTAGGCDEVAWDAGWEIIQNMM
jgi:hypothetical protein